MQAIFKQDQVRIISQWVLSRIKTRTLEGIDKDGKEFRAYSKKLFAIPAGATTKKVLKLLMSSGEGVIRTFGGKHYLIVPKGYIAYKKAYMNGTDWDGEVNLSLTGNMLRDMNVISIDGNTFTIGWARTELAERAGYNIDKGRDFLGLSPEDLEDPRLLSMLTEGIEFVE